MLSLPVPPSLNNLFANRQRGRFKTDAYKAWIEAAGWELNLQRPLAVRGSVEISIFLPEKMLGDIDNRAKPVLDLLVKHKLIDDDRNVRRLVLERDARCVTTCLVDVKARAA